MVFFLFFFFSGAVDEVSTVSRQRGQLQKEKNVLVSVSKSRCLERKGKCEAFVFGLERGESGRERERERERERWREKVREKRGREKQRCFVSTCIQ